MPCPKPADMAICDPKCRCSTGACAGIAFHCDDPCGGVGTFNSSTCECDATCASSWEIVYTSATSGDFGPCGASCGYTPTFNNLITVSAPGAGFFSTTNFAAINGACGGPSLSGQTLASTYGIDYFWTGAGWANASAYPTGSSTDSIALKITICEGPEAGVTYAQIIYIGTGSNQCNLLGQILTVTSATPA